MFPFMIEELGELDEKARLFVMVCESVVKNVEAVFIPETAAEQLAAAKAAQNAEQNSAELNA